MSRPWKRSATIIQSSTLMAEASITGGLIRKVLNLVHEYDYLVTSSLVGWGGSTENGSIFGQVSEVYAKVTGHQYLLLCLDKSPCIRFEVIERLMFLNKSEQTY